MKKINIFVSLLAISMVSCSKKADAPSEVETVEVTLSEGESYARVLGTRPGTEGEITKEPSHAAVSRIPVAPTSTTTVYEYVPQPNFAGNDSVTIVVTTAEEKNKCGSHSSAATKKT